MASMRSVFARIACRSIGFGMSVWQQATEYLMCSIRGFRLSANYADFADRKLKSAWTDQLSRLALNSFLLLPNQRNLCNLRISPRQNRPNRRYRRSHDPRVVFLNISSPLGGQRIMFRP